MGKTKLCISYRLLKAVAMGMLLLPVLIFMLFYVKLLIGIPVALAMIAVFILSIKDGANDKRYIEISYVGLICLFLFCAVWCFLGGQGGYFFQTSDWNERNAIFRDLLTRGWPVYYPVTDTMLTYYIGHWLPAAAVGRALFRITGNLPVVWEISNFLLFLWTTVCVFIVLLLLLHTVQAKGKKAMLLSIAVFVGFSGLDIIGCIIKQWLIKDFFVIMHLEWWVGELQFSAITTCLFWVFNQAVPAWLATFLFLNEKNNKNYAFLIVCAFLSAPLPCVGLVIYMFADIIIKAVKAYEKRKLKDYIIKSFSVSNVVSVLLPFPILAAYFLSNSALNNSNAVDTANSFPWKAVVLAIITVALFVYGIYVMYFSKKTASAIKKLPVLPVATVFAAATLSLYLHPDKSKALIAFLTLEVGVYLAAIWIDNLFEPLFYITSSIFVIAPAVKIGISADFCMRASIPAVIVLVVMCIKFLLSEKDYDDVRLKKLRRFCKIVVIICIIIGLFTPAMELFRGVYNCIEQGQLSVPCDKIITLNKYHFSGDVYGNFVSTVYKNSLFFRFFAA